MLNISISKDTQKNISQVVGVDYSAIIDYDPLEEMSLIGRPVLFSKKRDLKKSAEEIHFLRGIKSERCLILTKNFQG